MISCKVSIISNLILDIVNFDLIHNILEWVKGITTWSMEAVLQSQLDRVETALTTLIESIASYNPSLTAARDLLAADDELNNGVEQRINSL